MLSIDRWNQTSITLIGGGVGGGGGGGGGVGGGDLGNVHCLLLVWLSQHQHSY